MMALCSCSVSVTIYQLTECHTPEDLYLLTSFTASEEHHTALTSKLFRQYLLQLDVTSQKALLQQLLNCWKEKVFILFHKQLIMIRFLP
jgi:hypothetical protein